MEKNDSQVQVKQVAPGFFTLYKYHSDSRRHEPVVGERTIQGRLNRHHQTPDNTVDHTEVDSHNHNAVTSGGHFGKDSEGEFYREKGRASSFFTSQKRCRARITWQRLALIPRIYPKQSPPWSLGALSQSTNCMG